MSAGNAEALGYYKVDHSHPLRRSEPTNEPMNKNGDNGVLTLQSAARRTSDFAICNDSDKHFGIGHDGDKRPFAIGHDGDK
ncbi:hypothetical protein P3T76_002246 [Phytophthora citrophthora]|uniref:Uncharacterized protein n=1 Tax=Phytophthora citrophthora TaxID=4793 RepID=A0AAD9GX47_9STRA|nr:hypothetical protein P3T76_002246 [Phytophthora citrophthora]